MSAMRPSLVAIALAALALLGSGRIRYSPQQFTPDGRGPRLKVECDWVLDLAK